MKEKLQKLWVGYERAARIIGGFRAPVRLTPIYAALLLPFGLVIRLFADSLHINQQPTHWLDHPREAMDIE